MLIFISGNRKEAMLYCTHIRKLLYYVKSSKEVLVDMQMRKYRIFQKSIKEAALR